MSRRRGIYDLWLEYDNFIRSLHLETLEKRSKYTTRRRFFNYLKKLPVILVASFLTTLTFQFFINPNNLFNSGLSGIIQVVTNYFFVSNGVSEQNRTVWYYAVTVLINSLIVLITQFFYPFNFEINSTAIFYVLFQFIWSSLFRYYSLQKYFFSRFSPQSWSNLSSVNQLGLTFPFYITIAIVSAVIHTYGYGLIYWAKSTPGGFEIITSTLAQDERRKKKISIGSLNKLFSIFVVFFITIFNFFLVNDNNQLKVKGLIDLLNDKMSILGSENYKKIESENDLKNFLKESDKKDYWEIIKKLLVDWSGDDFFLKLPGGICTYLQSKEQLIGEFLQLKEKRENIIHDLSEMLEKKDKGDGFLFNEDSAPRPGSSESRSSSISATELSDSFLSNRSDLNFIEQMLQEVKRRNFGILLSKLEKNFSSDDEMHAFLWELVNENLLFSSEKDLNNFLRKVIKREKIFIFNIIVKIEEMKKTVYKKNFLGYFRYITNDEKLWASLIYIFLSSYLINQIFPKSKTVLLTSFLENSDNLEEMLKVLQKYNPKYFKFLPKKEEEEKKENYLLLCLITKWDYQLLAGEINKLGKVLINTLNESN